MSDKKNETSNYLKEAGNALKREQFEVAGDNMQRALNTAIDQTLVEKGINSLGVEVCDLTGDMFGTNATGCNILRDVVASRDKGQGR